EAEQFIRAAALRKQDRHVVPAYQTEVAVHRINRTQKRRGRTGRGQRGRDLARDEAGFPHAGDDHASLGLGQQAHGRGERRPQALGDSRDRLRFEGQYPSAALNEGERHRRSLPSFPYFPALKSLLNSLSRPDSYTYTSGVR